MIKVTDDMSDLKSSKIDYDKMSARLLMQKVYHEAFGSIKPLRLQIMLGFNMSNGLYSRELIDMYSDTDIDELSLYIDYNRNFNFTKAGLQSLIDKYMIKHNGKLIEDPQTMFMAISMDIFKDFKSVNKLKMVKDTYDALSKFKISFPTPMMKSLRTGSYDIASCIVLEVGDSINSWTTSFDAIVKHTCSNAGVGIDASMVSSIGDKVKDGKISHSGKIPLYRAFDALVQTSTQNGRRGSATTHTFFCDPEIETVLALKSPKTEATKRINDLKHTIKINQYLMDKVINGEDIYLISPRKAKYMYEKFHDNKKFGEMYEENILAGSYSSKINGRELMEKLLDARVENGVYYLFFADNVNDNSPFKEIVTQSNICMEISLPTKPLSSNSNNPEIAVCVLSNINMGTVKKEELQHYTKLLVYVLNEVIHKQKHPTKQANAFIKQYAALGIGLSNGAYYLASNGLKYGSDETLQDINEYVEAFQYNLIRASAQYAKEFDACVPKFYKSKYSNYNFLSQREGKCDWIKLANYVRENGMANTALSSVPPSESSSLVGNQCSSIEPIKEPLTIKDSKTGQIKQYAPEALRLADKYDYAFDTKDMTERYLKTVAVFQKWIDQSLSTQTFYNPELYEDRRVPLQQVWNDIKLAKELGLKTLYYNNIYVADNENQYEECEGCTV
jgi:ribonucleoside-diphosphate reductase alpha chain